MPVSCHFRGCKAPLFRIVNGAISSELALPFTSNEFCYTISPQGCKFMWYKRPWQRFALPECVYSSSLLLSQTISSSARMAAIPRLQCCTCTQTLTRSLWWNVIINWQRHTKCEKKTKATTDDLVCWYRVDIQSIRHLLTCPTTCVHATVTVKSMDNILSSSALVSIV